MSLLGNAECQIELVGLCLRYNYVMNYIGGSRSECSHEHRLKYLNISRTNVPNPVIAIFHRYLLNLPHFYSSHQPFSQRPCMYPYFIFFWAHILISMFTGIKTK